MLEYSYSLVGGSLNSIKVDGVERMYQPMEGSWGGHDVVIFPFIARLIGQTYTHKGVSYSMKNHGLARYNEFKVVEEKENSSKILFESNEETLKQYPFNFKIYVTYKKENNKLYVSYEVVNTGNEVMPFGLGGHPAIKVVYENNDTKGNKVIFDQPMDLTQYTLEETASFITGTKKIGTYQEFEVDKDFFKFYKTLMLDAKDIKAATLVRADGKKIRYEFDCKYLAIWSFPNNGDYVCVEPWDSLPDFVGSSTEMMEKESLIHLEPGKTYKFGYSMEFINCH